MTAKPTVEDLRHIVEQVWSSYLDLDGNSPLVPAVGALDDADAVSASVSVTGSWQGHVVVSCSVAASRNAASALMGVGVDDVTVDDVSDAVGELANIIGGNVKSLLPQPCALSLPQVVVEETTAARYPGVIEVGQLNAVWLGEPITVRVLESTVDVVGVRAA
jgi:chemotaxis protein CheX